MIFVSSLLVIERPHARDVVQSCFGVRCFALHSEFAIEKATCFAQYLLGFKFVGLCAKNLKQFLCGCRHVCVVPGQDIELKGVSTLRRAFLSLNSKFICSCGMMPLYLITDRKSVV